MGMHARKPFDVGTILARAIRAETVRRQRRRQRGLPRPTAAISCTRGCGEQHEPFPLTAAVRYPAADANGPCAGATRGLRWIAGLVAARRAALRGESSSSSAGRQPARAAAAEPPFSAGTRPLEELSDRARRLAQPWATTAAYRAMPCDQGMLRGVWRTALQQARTGRVSDPHAGGEYAQRYYEHPMPTAPLECLVWARPSMEHTLAAPGGRQTPVPHSGPIARRHEWALGTGMPEFHPSTQQAACSRPGEEMPSPLAPYRFIWTLAPVSCELSQTSQRELLGQGPRRWRSKNHSALRADTDGTARAWRRHRLWRRTDAWCRRERGQRRAALAALISSSELRGHTHVAVRQAALGPGLD